MQTSNIHLHEKVQFIFYLNQYSEVPFEKSGEPHSDSQESEYNRKLIRICDSFIANVTCNKNIGINQNSAICWSNV